MDTKLIIRRIILLLISVLFFGCTPERTNIQVAQQTSSYIPETLQPPAKILSATSAHQGIIPSNTPKPNSVWQLTFVSNRGGSYGLYALDFECLDRLVVCISEPRLLFKWNDSISDVDWSPDGKRVAFASGLYSSRIFMADWNGKNAVSITGNCADARSPKWSPDGTQIAMIYSAGRPGCESLESSQILIFDLKTNQTVPILRNVQDATSFHWLSQRRFAYNAKSSIIVGKNLISIVDQNGDMLYHIPENAKEYDNILGLSFSPDGKQAVFVGEDNPLSSKTTIDLYITDLNGGPVANLTKGGENNFSPAWSPFGDWIAFESNRKGDYEIYIIKSSGIGLQNITNDTADDGYPAWRLETLP